MGIPVGFRELLHGVAWMGGKDFVPVADSADVAELAEEFDVPLAGMKA
jgi:hypothetical protein